MPRTPALGEAFAPALLRLRGGGGISTTRVLEEAARITTALVSTEAAFMNLAPASMIEIMEELGTVESCSSLCVWVVEFSGAALVAWSILAWCALARVRAATALGVAAIPFAVTSLKAVFSGACAKLGVLEDRQLLSAGLHFAFAIILSRGHERSIGPVARAAVLWALVNGLSFAAAPATARKAWGVPKDSKVDFFFRSLGHYLIAVGFLGGALLLGQGATAAIALSIIPLIANFIRPQDVVTESIPPNCSVTYYPLTGLYTVLCRYKDN